MTSVLQKLLHPGMSQLIRERGYSQVGGFVVEAGAARDLSTGSTLREAYGVSPSAEPWVDVVRFALPACAMLSAPPHAERPWPTYPSGFLRPVRSAIVPVWILSTTRYSPGAELWRVHDDGRQEFIAAYEGAARGWIAASGVPPVREWHPSSRYVGTRAVWNGTEYAADVRPGDVEITSYVEPGGDGWVQHRGATWSRTLSPNECEVYELSFRAALDGVPVRVLEVTGSTVRAQLLTDDPAVAGRLSAVMVDYGVFEVAGVAGQALTNTQLLANGRG